MKVRCTNCDLMIPDTHPTCGIGWDLCEICMGKICDSACQDIPLYCAHCHAPLDDRNFIGEHELSGDAIHAPGHYWIFECKECDRFSRCHKSTEKTFMQAIKEVKEQRE